MKGDSNVEKNEHTMESSGQALNGNGETTKTTFYKRILKALSCLVVILALLGVLLSTSKDLGNVVLKEKEVMHLEMINYTTEKNLESFNEINHFCESRCSLDNFKTSYSKSLIFPSKTKLEELNGWVMAFVMTSITMKNVDLIMVTAVVAI